MAREGDLAWEEKRWRRIASSRLSAAGEGRLAVGVSDSMGMPAGGIRGAVRTVMALTFPTVLHQWLQGAAASWGLRDWGLKCSSQGRSEMIGLSQAQILSANVIVGAFPPPPITWLGVHVHGAPRAGFAEEASNQSPRVLTC